MENVDIALLLVVLSYSFFVYVSAAFIHIFKINKNVKKDYSYEPTISVLLSAFNEGEAAYGTIKSLRESDYPVEKLAILAFDDGSSDDTFDWLSKAAADFPNVTARRNSLNKGKALTVLDAARASNGEILVGVDSDCIFRRNALRELVVCFAEPRIGAVGGRVGLMNPDESLITRCQAITYANSFLLSKAYENAARKIQCLSGPLVAIRRDRFFEIEPELASRNFLGLKVMTGEDRALTQIMLRAGYDTYLNLDAVCITNVPATYSGYMKQQLRWRRSAIGQWLATIFDLPTMIKKNSVTCAVFSIWPIFVIISWNALFLLSWFSGQLFLRLVYVIIFHAFVSPIGALFLNAWLSRRVPSEAVTDRIKLCVDMVLFAFWYPLSAFIITLFAAFTLDDTGWVTRASTTTTTDGKIL